MHPLGASSPPWAHFLSVIRAIALTGQLVQPTRARNTIGKFVLGKIIASDGLACKEHLFVVPRPGCGNGRLRGEMFAKSQVESGGAGE